MGIENRFDCNREGHGIGYFDRVELKENLISFKDSKIAKLSCVLQLNEGINIPELRQGIIMHAYGNERKASQRIGRLLRLNPQDKAIVHILCYTGTVDERWVKEALEGFDQSKILWKDYGDVVHHAL